MQSPIETVKSLQKTPLNKAAIDKLIADFKLHEPAKIFTENGMPLVNGIDVNAARNMLLSLHFITAAKANKILDQLVLCGVCELHTIKVQSTTVLYLIPLDGSGLALKRACDD